LSVVKLHTASLSLAESAAVVGNLRAVRFAPDSAWRSTALLGALDELRHAQIPLRIMHELVRWDVQFDWTHRLFHSNNWLAIAARHFVDELLLGADPVEFAVATHFVLESGFTNLQFVGLSAMARLAGDPLFEKMVQSIQTDEARHAQIGGQVLEILVRHDREYAQSLIDKWFWRSWRFFSVVTGVAMDYLTPLECRPQSFKQFVHEWVLDQFDSLLARHGLERPWYWQLFLDSIETYHHMVYASAYTYRASVWFDCPLPGPREREWLRARYPETWPLLDPIWEQVSARWRASGPGVEWYVHGATPMGLCHLCQLVLCGGTPEQNTARVVQRGTEKHVFCSEPCEWLFLKDPERYERHKGLIARILEGEAPANLVEHLRSYFGMHEGSWGRDVLGGRYAWLERA